AAYQEARRALADELGIEPSPALRDLERRILQQDASPDLEAPAAVPEPAPAAPVEAAGAQMLKLVTGLFADVAGPASTPEELRDLLDECFAVVAPEIEAEGGAVERLVGGGIMAVFGVPAVHEDDPVRAVRAARRMVEHLRTWREGRFEI